MYVFICICNVRFSYELCVIYINTYNFFLFFFLFWLYMYTLFRWESLLLYLSRYFFGFFAFSISLALVLLMQVCMVLCVLLFCAVPFFQYRLILLFFFLSTTKKNPTTNTKRYTYAVLFLRLVSFCIIFTVQFLFLFFLSFFCYNFYFVCILLNVVLMRIWTFSFNNNKECIVWWKQPYEFIITKCINVFCNVQLTFLNEFFSWFSIRMQFNEFYFVALEFFLFVFTKYPL